MSEQSEEAPDELGIFIGGDGHRAIDAPWRLHTYDAAGPLTTSQISFLSHRFDLPVASLGKLSKRLGFVLNPAKNIHVIPASRATARQSARSNVARAKRQLKAIRDNLSAVIESLSSVISEDDDEESPYSSHYAEILSNLETGQKALVHAEGALQSLASQPGALVRWQPLDRRELTDRRRDQVLGAVFQFWVDAGRNIGFTTDPKTSKRSGEFVDFSQSLCLFLTDPPTKISSETIVRTIRTKGKRYRPMPEWALSMINGQKSES